MSSRAVERYLVELEQPAAGWGELQAVPARARAAAAELRMAGTPVRFLRSIFVPEDDACLLLFEAPSPEAAGEAGRRADVVVERVTPAVRP
jgi:Nickel responsive protein SCO4226-like